MDGRSFLAAALFCLTPAAAHAEVTGAAGSGGRVARLIVEPAAGAEVP